MTSKHKEPITPSRLRQSMIEYRSRGMINDITQYDMHPSLAHTKPVIYYPNYPVYDLDLPQGSLNRVGDNVDPNQGEW